MAEKKLFRLDWDKELPKAETPTYDPEKQVAGLQKRIAGAGLDPEKAADTRNPVERALNLKPDQNLLFDVFEIINRPQQAIFGGIEAAQKGTDVGEGIVKGLTGQKEVRGTDLLQNAGMQKNLGTDALGFILDVFADPIDLALIPVSGGLSLATNLLDGAADVSKIVALSKTATDAASKARYLDEAAESAYNIMKANSKGLKVKFDSLDEFKTVVNKYKIEPDQYLRNVSGSIRQFISPIEAGFGLAGKGVKGVLRGSDKLLTVALRGVDDALGLTPEVVKAAKGVQELAIPGMKLSDDVMSIANDFSKVTKDVVDNMGYLNKYTNFKDSISKLTNYVAGLPKKLAFKAKLAQGGSELSSNKLIYLNKEIAKDFDDYVTAQIKVNPEYMNLSFEDAKVLAGKKMQLRQEITGAYNPKYTFKSYLEKGNNLVPRDVDAGVKEDLINFDFIVPDYVHVLEAGRIVRSGDKELAKELEAKGYGWLEQEVA
jgi:methyl-accepting chemotaxis protein